MTKTKLLVSTVAERLDHIFIENKIAVGTKKIVRHQVGVMRGCKHLAWKNKESLAHGKGQFEMVESVEFVDEDERCISHLVHPEIQKFKVLGASGCNDVERDSLIVNDAEQILVSGVGCRKLEYLPADFPEEFPEIIDKFVFDNVFVQQGDVCFQADEFTNVQAAKPQHSINEFIQS